MHVHNHHHLQSRCLVSFQQAKKKGKERKGKPSCSIIRIIVSAAAYPCPYLCPHRHRHFHRLIQNSATTYQQIPCRQVVPQYEPSDHRLAGVKADLARRIVPVIRPLSPTQLEKKIRADHR